MCKVKSWLSCLLSWEEGGFMKDKPLISCRGLKQKYYSYEKKKVLENIYLKRMNSRFSITNWKLEWRHIPGVHISKETEEKQKKNYITKRINAKNGK